MFFTAFDSHKTMLRNIFESFVRNQFVILYFLPCKVKNLCHATKAKKGLKIRNIFFYSIRL